MQIKISWISVNAEAALVYSFQFSASPRSPYNPEVGSTCAYSCSGSCSLIELSSFQFDAEISSERADEKSWWLNIEKHARVLSAWTPDFFLLEGGAVDLWDLLFVVVGLYARSRCSWRNKRHRRWWLDADGSEQVRDDDGGGVSIRYFSRYKKPARTTEREMLPVNSICLLQFGKISTRRRESLFVSTRAFYRNAWRINFLE